MSPEELEATREGANVDYAPDIAYEDWQAMARALLAHIDSQAVTINNLAAALDEAKVDQVNFSSACQEELDTQAAQIETLKEDIEVMKLGEKAADGLILQGRKYAEQIEALKEKLVEQLAKYFVLQQAQCTFRTPIKGSMMSKCDKGVICDWNVCPIKDEWEERARQQLAQEMPEVDWK